MASRRGPEEGYDFGNKRQYRRNVWNTFREFWDHRPMNHHALLMPSIEGDEIEEAERHGFTSLHVCDDNPAIVATLKRRYPAIHTYGVKVGKAAQRIRQRGINLTAANLDFTSCVCRSLLDEVAQVAASVIFAPIAVTLQRGREREFEKIVAAGAGVRGVREEVKNHRNEIMPALWKNARPVMEWIRRVCGEPWDAPDFTDADWGRVQLVIERMRLAGRNAVYFVRGGVYKSRSEKLEMLWFVAAVHRRPCLCVYCLAADGYPKSPSEAALAIRHWNAGELLTMQDGLDQRHPEVSQFLDAIGPAESKRVRDFVRSAARGDQ